MVKYTEVSELKYQKRLFCEKTEYGSFFLYSIYGKETANIILSAEISKEFANQLNNNNIVLKLNYKNEKGNNKYFKIYKGNIEENK